ncbi:UNVERIFIED_CONTAM: protein REVEILLE 1 [Sesamum latifolium]|uniref:Protein REVEILLE 1 n=1 Tax=Sesamum latifolium TaxID=2727402 RepID=A0AAW2YAZ0_9LAMI
MVATAMAVQEHTGSDAPLPTNDNIPFDLGTPTGKGNQLREQFNAGDDFAPKARKPYTITKQRERWTEEEHKKFIEALKLYGRAWRKIEEVFLQGFTALIPIPFSAIISKCRLSELCESNTGDTSSVKAIEIPPPRPKRKPSHPYPRKLVPPVKTGIRIPEKPTSSGSPNTSEQENQSPTSVLSTIGSDSSVGPDSCMPNGSPSPVSSGIPLNAGMISCSEAPKCLSEDGDHEDENSSPDEEIPLELELSSQNTALVKEDPSESAAQSLKLFGKTLLVADPRGPSRLTPETCKAESFDISEGSCLFPLRVVPLKFPKCNYEYESSAFPDRSVPVYTTDKSSPVDGHHPVPFPWLTLCSDASSSTPEVHSPIPIKAQLLCDKKERLDNDEQKEGTSTSSNTDNFLGPPTDGGKNWGIDSCRLSLERKGTEGKSFSSYKLSKRISANSLNCRKGFVPYKRCFAEPESISSTETAEEREKQRIRLCL